MTAKDAESGKRVETTAQPGTHPRALAPDVAFRIIGNETRLAILDALWGPREPGLMTFADLRRAVGMGDGSQFNYHLKKLVDGGFVAKVDDRYQIRQAGARVICTVRTGYLTDHPEIDAFETTGRCFACGGRLVARYADEMFVVACSDCDELHSRGWFPPNGLIGRTAEEALRAGETAMRASIHLAAAGICPVCNGQTVRTLSRTWSDIPVVSPSLDETRDATLRAWYVCGHCGAWTTHSPGDAVIDHPAVVALYADHGVDIRATPRWELPWTVDPSVVEVVSEDPFRLRLTVALDGDVRVLTLDDTFAVISVERSAETGEGAPPPRPEAGTPVPRDDRTT